MTMDRHALVDALGALAEQSPPGSAEQGLLLIASAFILQNKALEALHCLAPLAKQEVDRIDCLRRTN
jgi:hypothetical protein